MADTTTTTYLFTKPEVGASADTWGAKININLDTLDNLFDGTTPVTGIDVNSGSIDGTPIGAATPSTGSFTTIVVTGTVDGRDVAADGTKLDGIETGATADQTAAQLLTAIKTVDGAGSGLDADLLDGISSANYLRSNISDTFTGTLSVTGDIVATGNITAYSDARIKADITPIANALEKVNQIGGYTYTRTDLEDQNTRHTGLLAQELLSVLPEAVLQGASPDDLMSVAYGNTVGLLVEAIKELTAKVAKLEAK